MMFDDTNWDTRVMSPPLKELCYFFTKVMSHAFKNGLHFLITFTIVLLYNHAYTIASFFVFRFQMDILMLLMARSKPCNGLDPC